MAGRWIAAALVAATATLAVAAERDPYWVAARFDAVEGATAYRVVLSSDGVDLATTFEAWELGTGTLEAEALGGDPMSTTSVAVVALAGELESRPSNVLEIPPLFAECRRFDVNDDGQVSATDALAVMAEVLEQRCALPAE